MTTLCDAGCSRVATTRGADGADYCPECYKASKGGRRETAPKCLFDGQITAGYGCGKPHGHMDECEAAIPSDAYQQWANTQA